MKRILALFFLLLLNIISSAQNIVQHTLPSTDETGTVEMWNRITMTLCAVTLSVTLLYIIYMPGKKENQIRKTIKRFNKK